LYFSASNNTDVRTNGKTYATCYGSGSPADTTPPSTPTNLTATAVSSTQINLSWTASTDTGGSGLAGYKVFRGGVQIATPAGTSYSDTNLTPSTAYTYTVAAYDAANNTSAQSSQASATTQAPPDTQPPTTPTNLTATPISSTQINLSWTASTDNTAVTGYKVFRGGTQIATTTGTSYSNTGLSRNTTYMYTVAAYDAAGNVSAQSAPASAKTRKFNTNEQIQVAQGPLNVRSCAGTTCSVKGKQTTLGRTGTVTGVPTEANGFTW